MPSPIGDVGVGDNLIWDGAVFSVIHVPAQVTTEDVTSVLDVGGIAAQEVIPKGTNITQFVKKLLLATFYPTFNAPGFSLTSNQSNGQEIGAVTNLILTYNFNRGLINGKMVG